MRVTVNRLVATNDVWICAVEVQKAGDILSRLRYYGMQPLAFNFEGTFTLVKYFSPKHQAFVPLIENVPAHEGLEIHIVNTVADTLGCLGISDNILNEEFITNSAAAVHEFYADFFAACAINEPCSINFKNLL